MKLYSHITLIIAGVLFSVAAHSVNKNREYLSRLHPFLLNDFVYNDDITPDSIIRWEKQLEPELLANENYEMIFHLKYLAINAYITQGNISLALNDARLMYKKAKEMNYVIGIAFALRAIGDTYLNSAMIPEAIDSYKESLKLLESVFGTDNYLKQSLSAFILTLLKTEKNNEAQSYIKQLEYLCKKDANDPLNFYLPICQAFCYIQNGEAEKGLEYIEEAETFYQNAPFSHFRNLLYYMYANYYKSKKKYEQALKRYDLLLQEIQTKVSYKYTRMLEERANLLMLMGRAQEACIMCQFINEKKDSLSTLNYVQQINELRVLYQVDQTDFENQIQKRQIILWSIVVALLILMLIIYFIFHMRIENRRLRKSKQELELAKKQAENSIRTKSLFLSNMSHEIRTPLNALSGFSSILTEESIDNKTRKQCNDIIQQNSELLLKLINDVIDLSNLEIGQMKFNFKEHDAVAICRNVINMVDKIKQTNAEAKFITSLNSLILITDSSRLQQLLINLLINATKFTQQGSISLELIKETDDTALFSITDTGCGIPSEKQKQIFNRFEKLDENAQGTGLGLSICQLIVEQLGGKIWIDPQYTNGSRFLFTHPIKSENQEMEESK